MGIFRFSANFTRPNNATPYVSGQLVANSVTAGSVVPLSFAIPSTNGGGLAVWRARLRKSATSITNAVFRLHLFTAAPTVANGDGGTFSSSQAATYLGSFDITVGQTFTDGGAGFAAPAVGDAIRLPITGNVTLSGLLEARGAYTPAAQEVLTVELEAEIG